MIIATYDNYDFANQIEYTFNLIFSTYGISFKIIPLKRFKKGHFSLSETVLISYGKNNPELGVKHHVHIYASDFFGKNYLKLHSMPKTPLKKVNRKDFEVKKADLFMGETPVIFRGSEKNILRDSQLIPRGSHFSVCCPIDLIASIFYMVSRYEETVIKKRDSHNRFPASESLAWKEGFLHRPIVNEYIDLLWSWIEEFNLGYKRKSIWNGKNFAVCLTHDVDQLRKYKWYPPLRTIAGSTLKYGKPRKSLALSKDYLKAKLKSDPYDTFSYLINLSKKYGLGSSFYLMSGGKTAFDRRYKINSRKLVSIIRNIQKNGFEIGLHTSFDAYKNAALISSEKATLEKVLGNEVLGVRQHYLRWKTPESWRAREAAGIKYDTSLSFADHEGFRAGICIPFKPFDILENRELDLWELPLISMDGSLYTYQRLSPDKAFIRVKSLIDTVKKHKGVFVILWHNSSFDEVDWPGWSHLYEKILIYINKQSVYSNTALGIIKRWEDEIYK